MSLPDLSVRRPIMFLMTTVAVVTFGYLAAARLPVDLLPDLSYPTLTVQTLYPDAAPVSVEQFVTRPVEEAVGVIPGVREMRSVSRAGLSEVILEFEWDEEIDFIALDVREKLGLVRLPDEAEPPRLLRFDPSLDPIVRVAFAGDRPLDELRQMAERWVKPRLEAVKGVAAAKVRGGLDPEIVVEADEDRLAALGMAPEDVATALQAENVNQPGGTLKDFNAVYLVRTLHEFDDLEQLRRTVVRESPTGRVRVEDVATVSRSHRDRDEITRSGGREVVELALHREGSANTVAVAAAIHEEIARLRGEMSADLSLTVLTDQSTYIAEAVAQVWSAALLGGILAILVIYFFLRDLPSTAIIAVSIPVSVIASFLPMQQAGVSLNIMSLGGLALGVGMLVDNSIVVLEAIDRQRQQGLSRSDAAVRGARDVAGAVVASTLTTVSVFFPIVFVQGIAGQLFYDQAITVCFSLVVSMLVALTLIPSLAALDTRAIREGSFTTLFRWDAPVVAGAPPVSLASRVSPFLTLGLVASGLLFFVLFYLLDHTFLAQAGLALCLVFPAVIFADLLFPFLGTIHMFGFTMGAIGNGQHAFSRMASVYLYPLRLTIFIVLVGIGGLWQVSRRLLDLVFWPLARAMEGIGVLYKPALQSALRFRWLVLALAFSLFTLAVLAAPLLGTNLVPSLAQGEFAFQLRFPEGTPLELTGESVDRIESTLVGDETFANIFSLVGSLPSTASGRRTLGENLAQIDFVLADGGDGVAEAQAIARVRQVLDLYPRIDAELVRPSVLSVKAPISVQVFADDLDVLETAAAQVENAVRVTPGVVDVASSVEPGSPEVRVHLDRERAGAMGVTARSVASSLRRKVRGDKIGEFREGEERIDIRLRAALEDRERAADIPALRVRLPQGSTVPVSAVAEVQVGRGPASVLRAGGARVAEITAKAVSSDLGGTLDRIRATVAGLTLPENTSAEMAGQDRELQVSFNSLKMMLALAIFLVYVVMAAQFESLFHPFVILISVPLGTIGVVGVLLLTGNPVSVLVLIGAVMLAGIVVNNAIVLVDAINRRRREGQPLNEAVVAAGQERLRPILMTTSTTILALLPMAVGLGAGDELRAPLAITVIGGLAAATFLTLLVVPCLYRALSPGEAPAAALSRQPAGTGTVGGGTPAAPGSRP